MTSKADRWLELQRKANDTMIDENLGDDYLIEINEEGIISLSAIEHGFASERNGRTVITIITMDKITLQRIALFYKENFEDDVQEADSSGTPVAPEREPLLRQDEERKNGGGQQGEAVSKGDGTDPEE